MKQLFLLIVRRDGRIMCCLSTGKVIDGMLLCHIVVPCLLNTGSYGNGKTIDQSREVITE